MSEHICRTTTLSTFFRFSFLATKVDKDVEDEVDETAEVVDPRNQMIPNFPSLTDNKLTL
jgi:hypothetical protein